MKNSFFAITLFIICSLNAFCIENGRGIIEWKSPKTITLTNPKTFQYIYFFADSLMPFQLITGEVIPFYKAKLEWRMTINFEYQDSIMLSAAVDRSGEFGEEYIVGVLDNIDTTNQLCRVNGNLFKTNKNLNQHLIENITPLFVNNKSNLVALVYTTDFQSQEKLAKSIDIVHGGYRDVSRTGIIRNVFHNELSIGDPVDTAFQEKFLLHNTTKIFNKDFIEVSKSNVLSGSLVEVYAFYDTSLSRNFIYELHIKEIPTNDYVTVTGNGFSFSENNISCELGDFVISPTTHFTNFIGERISLNSLSINNAMNYTIQLNKKVNDYEVHGVKELPIIQRESTFDGLIAVYDSSQNTYLGRIAKSGIPPSIAINRFTTSMKDYVFEELPDKWVRFTTQKGSKSNNKIFMYNDVMAIEKPSTTENIYIGLVTEITNSVIGINDMRYALDSNCNFVNTNGDIGTINDINIGNYVVINRQNLIKNVYKFNPLEVIGRITNIQNDQITVGGFTFPAGEFTLYRGQGTQFTEKDKLLPNSLVKVLSLHGSTEAIAKFTDNTFPSNSATIARIVYVLQGPDPVSTNDPIVTPTIFPNPSSTTVSIAVPENVVSDITISTMLGERVFSKANVTGTTQFSTASLPIGQYLVKITNNKSTTNQILQVIR
ncbi:MAG: T9SS type A sorting domain-containing protein [Candidatus Kapabacteria bacterium]|nr:T9SS type A sorting domain-containing protein [Candidatus Kapabacteria bacterium]